jgi:hypothetical protein
MPMLVQREDGPLMAIIVGFRSDNLLVSLGGMVRVVSWVKFDLVRWDMPVQY